MNLVFSKSPFHKKIKYQLSKCGYIKPSVISIAQSYKEVTCDMFPTYITVLRIHFHM